MWFTSTPPLRWPSVKVRDGERDNSVVYLSRSLGSRGFGKRQSAVDARFARSALDVPTRTVTKSLHRALAARFSSAESRPERPQKRMPARAGRPLSARSARSLLRCSAPRRLCRKSLLLRARKQRSKRDRICEIRAIYALRISQRILKPFLREGVYE